MYSSTPNTKNNHTLTQRFANHVFLDFIHAFDFAAVTPRNALKNEQLAHIYENRGKPGYTIYKGWQAYRLGRHDWNDIIANCRKSRSKL